MPSGDIIYMPFCTIEPYPEISDANFTVTTGTSNNASTAVTITTSDWTLTAGSTTGNFDYVDAGPYWIDAGSITLAGHTTTGNVWTKEQEEERERARERAEKLLLRHLTPKQRYDYKKHGHFFVRTKRKHHYKIMRARDHNVLRLNKHGKPLRCLCISIYEIWVPVQDIMLAQKLLLETDEDAFLSIANEWAVREARAA